MKFRWLQKISELHKDKKFKIKIYFEIMQQLHDA